MKITIIAVGKIKESFYRDALTEYAKRLSKYCKLEIIEVADEKTPDTAGEREEENIRKKEGERILKAIQPGMQTFALAINGKALDSLRFADTIEKAGIQGNSWLAFVIGGSLGLHQDVLNRCSLKISFSAMTFPHQLMRVILLEQIYRAYRIINHEPYHK
ncbi:MAG: 23S rRNA (pseudouridine(1915)-N(3))-methyltransferase RlmH [Lachnospiraceae bacterium]